MACLAKWSETMSDLEVYLGIDTSCYTTSVAFMDRQAQLAGESRQILKVREGKCGLQQSEMVFQHTRNLPEMIKNAMPQGAKIIGVCASGCPRPLADSYMPAFLVGAGFARSLSVLNNIPLWLISHQENHLLAGKWSAGGPCDKRFLFLHASGGTTDLLLAEQQESGSFKLTEIGGSIDLHAGQFIDRIGVSLGLQFPAGPALEEFAKTADAPVELPVSVKELKASLSGPATAAERKLQAGADPAGIAAGVQKVLAETFYRLIINAAKQYNVSSALIAGGVASNAYIREYLHGRLNKKKISLWHPQARFSCDNACGCAAFAVLKGENRV